MLQGGGFSPGKLRAMLLGVEKRRQDEKEELEARFSLTSDLGEAEDRREISMHIYIFYLFLVICIA